MTSSHIFKALAVAATMGLMATGCASTKVTKTAQAAPITYKMGKGEAQYAALRVPTRPARPAAPRISPEITAPRGAQGRRFDASRVDRELYSHQRVGKTYTVMGQTHTPRHDPDYDREGSASWYGPKFHGKPTATGEIFDKTDLTAAHQTLPLNSMLYVTNLENGRSLLVRLNDRGPFVGDRIIDLSEASARELGFINQGTARVRVQYAGPADPMAAKQSLPKLAPRQVELPMDNIVPAPVPSPAPYVPPVTQPAPQIAQPQVAQPQIGQPIPAPIAPGQPQRAPSEDLPSGGDVTLTIKGPIHIARADDTQDQPRFIAERLQTR